MDRVCECVYNILGGLMSQVSDAITNSDDMNVQSDFGRNLDGRGLAEQQGGGDGGVGFISQVVSNTNFIAVFALLFVMIYSLMQGGSFRGTDSSPKRRDPHLNDDEDFYGGGNNRRGGGFYA